MGISDERRGLLKNDINSGPLVVEGRMAINRGDELRKSSWIDSTFVLLGIIMVSTTSSGFLQATGRRSAFAASTGRFAISTRARVASMQIYCAGNGACNRLALRALRALRAPPRRDTGTCCVPWHRGSRSGGDAALRRCTKRQPVPVCTCSSTRQH